MLWDTLAASLLENMLAGKGVIRSGEGVVPPHPLTNFEIQKNYQNESKFNSVYSGNNLPKIKDGPYLEYKSIGTHWTALYVNSDYVTYFDSFGLNIFQKKLKSSYERKISQEVFIKYNQMIQSCVDTFVLDLILC